MIRKVLSELSDTVLHRISVIPRICLQGKLEQFGPAKSLLVIFQNFKCRNIDLASDGVVFHVMHSESIRYS